MKKLFFLLLLVLSQYSLAQSELYDALDQESTAIEHKLIKWRRDIHQHPELGNQEYRTAKLIADHLRKLDIEVIENVAKTGVVGILQGAKTSPVVALRADMDALPVTERTPVPFASTVKVKYDDKETGVMHACGHDSHVAILMATAEVLAKHRNQLQGTVKFIFQPAEEGVFGTGEAFGANLMVKEGVLENPKVDAIFGLHINSQTTAGDISYTPGPIMAGVDQFYITVKGKQTHGAYPWSGIDPITTASQIVLGLNTIVSRNVKLIDHPAVVSVGSFQGGNRHNIIPEEVKLVGTIRTLDLNQRALIHQRIREIAENIAKSAGAQAKVFIEEGYPVTVNDENLTAFAKPYLVQAAGKNKVYTKKAVMGAEDFSYFAREVPGFFFILGAMEPGKKREEVAPHHTPDFYLHESGFIHGTKAFCNLVVNYFEKNK